MHEGGEKMNWKYRRRQIENVFIYKQDGGHTPEYSFLFSLNQTPSGL